MEAATKNRRGRPKDILNNFYEQTFNDMAPRTAQNTGYAGFFIVSTLKQKKGDFFVTKHGNFRRQGIAEQLGRMLKADLITEEQAKELAQWAIDDYNSGASVKQIESTLRLYRQTLQNAKSQK